ncbi:hypothetical protein DERF_014962 [Dermatophagoides farinae]|uniref:Uncharacterized protein n=1 Tax=Dermatophagoides farinae TaxID=6954 RepID=A0A922HNA2_DERFA|nr:hypothetical protein DERF_014962 [Dermatophagoides farinae]
MKISFHFFLQKETKKNGIECQIKNISKNYYHSFFCVCFRFDDNCFDMKRNKKNFFLMKMCHPHLFQQQQQQQQQNPILFQNKNKNLSKFFFQNLLVIKQNIMNIIKMNMKNANMLLNNKINVDDRFMNNSSNFDVVNRMMC